MKLYREIAKCIGLTYQILMRYFSIGVKICRKITYYRIKFFGHKTYAKRSINHLISTTFR